MEKESLKRRMKDVISQHATVETQYVIFTSREQNNGTCHFCISGPDAIEQNV